MQVDKEASVRKLATSSPHFAELYGKMLPTEWDRLWQSWQRETLTASGRPMRTGRLHD
jgi:hypothetical protein